MMRCATLSGRVWRAAAASWSSLPNSPFNTRSELVSLLDFGLPKAVFTQPCRLSHGAAAVAEPPAAAANHPTALLDGRSVAAAWQDELAADVEAIRAASGRPPGLGVILVGDRPDSLVYVARKREACERIGMAAMVVHLPASTAQADLRAAVRALCEDPTVDGLLVQLPLPPHIDEEDVIDHFDPAKDVDGFHPLNVGRTLMRGRTSPFVPCTALGCIELLQRSGVAVRGKSVVIVGDSNIVGMPLAMLFRDAGAATVTVVHRTSYSELFSDSPTETAKRRAQADACLPQVPSLSCGQQQPYEVNYSSTLREAYRHVPPQHEARPPRHLAELAAMTRTADILVVAVGYPQLVKRGWIKPGAVVLDVGINVVDWGDQSAAMAHAVQAGLVAPPTASESELQEDSAAGGRGLQAEGPMPFHVVGDVDFAEAVGVAAALTPVPGGVGPMTIAAVLHNTVQAAAANLGIELGARDRGRH